MIRAAKFRNRPFVDSTHLGSDVFDRNDQLCVGLRVQLSQIQTTENSETGACETHSACVRVGVE